MDIKYLLLWKCKKNHSSSLHSIPSQHVSELNLIIVGPHDPTWQFAPYLHDLPWIAGLQKAMQTGQKIAQDKDNQEQVMKVIFKHKMMSILKQVEGANTS